MWLAAVEKAANMDDYTALEQMLLKYKAKHKTGWFHMKNSLVIHFSSYNPHWIIGIHQGKVTGILLWSIFIYFHVLEDGKSNIFMVWDTNKASQKVSSWNSMPCFEHLFTVIFIGLLSYS